MHELQTRSTVPQPSDSPLRPAACAPRERPKSPTHFPEEPFFEVTNGSAIVAPGYVSCPSEHVPPRTLAAGETYSETYVWHGETNYQNGAIANLVAGFYSVNAAFPVNEHYVVRSEAVPLQILSGIFN